jgi:hypothetical protein
MRWTGTIVLKASVPLLLAIAALTVVAGLSLPHLEFRSDETTWLAQDDPVYLRYDRFKEVFGSDEVVIVAYDTPDPFDRSELEYLSYLTESLEKVPYIEETTSLTNVDVISAYPGGVKTKRFLKPSDAPTNAAERASLDGRIAASPFIEGVLISGDRSTLGIVLKVAKEEGDGEIDIAVDEAVQAFLATEHERTGRQFYVGGGPTIKASTLRIMARDMQLFTPLALAISGIVLFVIFRSFVCVALPLATVVLSMLWTFGLKALVGSPATPVSTTLVALITIIGVANSAHFIAQYRSELSRRSPRREALLATFERAGGPIFLTSLTTAIGFGSLTTSSIPLIRAVGAFASFGILTAFVLAMIIIPNGLRFVGSFRESGDRIRRTMGHTARFAVSNARLLIAVGLLICGVTAASTVKLQIEGSMLEYHKEGSDIRRAAEFLDDKLAGSSSLEVVIVGERQAFRNGEVLQQIAHLQRQVENSPAVAGSISMVDYHRALNEAIYGQEAIPTNDHRVDVVFRYCAHSEDIDIDEYYHEGSQDLARISIKTRRMERAERDEVVARIRSFCKHNLVGFSTVITGNDGMTWSVSKDIVRTQTRSLSIAVLLILGLFALFFGPRGAVASMLPNLLPITILFGVMAFAGFKLNVATITVASICIGLVVDDTIHYFAHFRHALASTGDRREAAVAALEEVGGALAFTALILSLGFGAFTLSKSAFLVQFGILAATALVVAFVADAVVTPALLSQLNFFPLKDRGRRR